MGRPRITQEDFISRAAKLHNNKYDYSKTTYKTMHDNIVVSCPLHGDFEVMACNHVKVLNTGHSPSGCPTCGVDHVRQRNKRGIIPFATFVKRADEVHDVQFSYVEEGYEGVNKKITIICPTHGEFRQIGYNHLRGSGCPRCKNSRGETIIAKTLSRGGYVFRQHHKVPTLRGVRGGHLEFDFYVPSYDLYIEYDGEHHFSPTKYNKTTSDAEAKRVFERTQEHDKKKQEFVDMVGKSLLRIPYTEKSRAAAMVIEAIEKQRQILVEQIRNQ